MRSTPRQPPVRSERWGRFWLGTRIALGVAGLAFVVWLVRDVGVEQLSAVLVPALAWLPIATALELARVGMDAWSTRLTLGHRGRELPLAPLLGSHLVAFAVMGIAPAGRATAEAVKASLLSRWIGGGAAVAAGTANQANTLLSSGTFTLASAGAAWVATGPSLLTWALLAHFVLMNLSGLALRAAARYERLGRWLGTRLPRIQAHVAAFHATSRATALYPPRPVGAMILGRVFQAGHFGVLAVAVGMAPGVIGALALHGVYLVIAAIGVMIPGQLGASEGGFAYSAELLDVTVAQATAIALLAHAVQLVLVAAGFVVLALWPSRRRDEPA
ncbi:MAG TPA: lysylphosphatidylglycerol synthase domain-containing protein [Sandaracinaceae bacterium LLY-WYZ-13_1]|nr:lysylphosphatidylglycerol synthase domain-containing protein [Sandaracinaceae bacterium LLY-WYZ-13_1]